MLNLYLNPEDNKESSIEISYLGVGYFLQKLIQNNLD